MNITTYTLSAPDSDSYFFDNASSDIFCEHCDCYLGERYLPTAIKVKSSFSDFGFTYDGRLLVSSRGKDTLVRYASTQLSFLEINQSEEIFVLHANDELQFDANARGSRFLDKCPVCDQYASVVGATPAYLLDFQEIDKSGFYRSDLEFGTGRE